MIANLRMFCAILVVGFVGVVIGTLIGGLLAFLTPPIIAGPALAVVVVAYLGFIWKRTRNV